ncbi:MAG: hypothetical protein LUF30_03950 [Lachnospiraceae bacterium]|nr:hypothetical protein [Lachnospiraceae bacterium]
MKTKDTAKNKMVDESVGLLENLYPLWVYPACAEARREKASGVEVALDTEGVAAGSEAESFHEAEAFYETELSKEAEPLYETEHFDSRAREVLASGGIVYLTPPATEDALPCSIKTQFTTDFWSVGNFPAQQGGMGQLIDADHPLFCNFPTEFHTNWQGWPMATQRAIILPEYKKSIVADMDSDAYMRPMTQRRECK